MGQLLHRRGQGVLLAAEAGHEAPAPDQAPVLQAAQGPLDLPPRQAQRVTQGEVAEDHPPAVEELLGRGLGQVVAVQVLVGVGHRRPPARGPARAHADPAQVGQGSVPRGGSALGRLGHPGPDGGEAVRHQQAPGHAVPQGPLDVVGQPAGRRGQVGGEARPPPAQQLEHLGRGPHGGLHGLAPHPGGRHQPAQVGPEDDGDGGGLGRGRAGGVGVVPGPGREPEPGHVAVVGELVQPGLVVVAQPAPEQLRLPRHGRGLEALQLLQHADQTGLPRQLGAGGHVLPPQQEAHEVLGRDRLHRLAPGPA